jgi:hypothetical protein
MEYYAVFNGYKNLDVLRLQETLFENIEINILQKYKQLVPLFTYSDDIKIQQDIEKLLFRIAIGNRKIYSIYKDDIPQFHGSTLYQILFSKGIIFKEFSREKPLKTPIKKEFRRYKIEDKIRFTKGFYRFWFTFIAPHKREIEKGNFDEVLEDIKANLDKFISFTFELFSNTLIKEDFNIIESGSYWDKHIELDVLSKTKDGKIIAGEVKYKNQKVSKNILNKLQKKCELSNIKADYYALFSKSGFSNELLKHHDKNVLLYDINSFKRLIDA